MSYDPDPSHYVNGSFIVWNLVDIVAKGGLFQIGYGPDRDGEFHPLAVAALHEAGDWLKVNGEAICASAAPSLSCVLPVLALRVRVRGRQHPPDAAALERHRVRLRPLHEDQGAQERYQPFASSSVPQRRCCTGQHNDLRHRHRLRRPGHRRRALDQMRRAEGGIGAPAHARACSEVSVRSVVNVRVRHRISTCSAKTRRR